MSRKGLLQNAAIGPFLYPKLKEPTRGKMNFLVSLMKRGSLRPSSCLATKVAFFLILGVAWKNPLQPQYFPGDLPFKIQVPRDIQAVSWRLQNKYLTITRFFPSKIYFRIQFLLISLATLPPTPFKVNVPKDIQVTLRRFPDKYLTIFHFSL